MNLVSSAIAGRYEAIGNPAEATHVIGLSFGHRGGIRGNYEPGPINVELAQYAIALGEVVVDKSWILQQEVADALAKLDVRWPPLFDIDMPRDPKEKYLNSWEVLSQAKAITDEMEGDYNRPLLVAHAHHVGRGCRPGA